MMTTPFSIFHNSQNIYKHSQKPDATSTVPMGRQHIINDKTLARRGKRLLFKRVINDTMVEYFCNKTCKQFRPAEEFTPSSIKKRTRICRACMKSLHQQKNGVPDQIERLRLCLANFLRKYKYKDVNQLATRERVIQVLETHKIDTSKVKHVRIYPPNDRDLANVSKYNVIVFDAYEERRLD